VPVVMPSNSDSVMSLTIEGMVNSRKCKGEE